MRHPYIAFALLILCGIVRPAQAYTPDSPEVRALVNRGVNFIEKHAQGGYYSRLGGTCLVGLTMYKYYGNADHPLVRAAVKKCRTVCQRGVSPNDSNYSLGVAIIFLGSLESHEHDIELHILLDALLQRRMANGAWSYADHATGDTSQTQYAALALWIAKRQQIPVEPKVVERLCAWLVRTQAPNGSWGYQGREPGNWERIKQDKETLSLATAGLGSTYVCADLLGLIDKPAARSDLPPAIRVVLTEEAQRNAAPKPSLPAAAVKRAILDGNNWFRRNFKIAASEYQHYYLYALERYMTFRQLAEHAKGQEPEWYNAGVEHLRDSQAADGSWTSCEAGPVIDTSFAVLFLLRSTQTTVEALSGTLGGPRPGLATSELRATDWFREIAELDLSALGPEGVPRVLSLSDDPKLRADELARFRRLAISGPFATRLLAVQTISRARDLNNVPALIYALSDPDERIAKAARDGLRFISRKTTGFSLPDKPTVAERKVAVERWKKWFLSVRPDGEFIE